MVSIIWPKRYGGCRQSYNYSSRKNMTPEAKVKMALKDLLRKLHAYWHMPVQNGMGSPALDFHVCLPIVVTQEMVGKTVGLYVGVETKRPGGQPTTRQSRTMDEIRAAHGIALLIDGNTDALIEGIIKQLGLLQWQ
jgi:hypothetical protein